MLWIMCSGLVAWRFDWEAIRKIMLRFINSNYGIEAMSQRKEAHNALLALRGLVDSRRSEDIECEQHLDVIHGYLQSKVGKDSVGDDAEFIRDLLILLFDSGRLRGR